MSEDNSTMDFDQAVAEVTVQEGKVTIGGQTFSVNLSPRAGAILRWMEGGQELAGIPTLLQTFFSKEDYETLLSLDIGWRKLEALVSWLAGHLGGQGNLPDLPDGL